jgi:hypothetical protein
MMKMKDFIADATRTEKEKLASAILRGEVSRCDTAQLAELERIIRQTTKEEFILVQAKKVSNRDLYYELTGTSSMDRPVSPLTIEGSSDVIRVIDKNCKVIFTGFVKHVQDHFSGGEK